MKALDSRGVSLFVIQEFVNQFHMFCLKIEKFFEFSVRCVQMDNGDEFVNKSFNDYTNNHGTKKVGGWPKKVENRPKRWEIDQLKSNNAKFAQSGGRNAQKSDQLEKWSTANVL